MSNFKERPYVAIPYINAQQFKEATDEKFRKKVKCECGLVLAQGSLSGHRKSKVHKDRCEKYCLKCACSWYIPKLTNIDETTFQSRSHNFIHDRFMKGLPISTIEEYRQNNKR